MLFLCGLIILRYVYSTPEILQSEENIPVHLTTDGEIQAYLASVSDESVKAIIHLDGDLHSANEKELYDILSKLEVENRERTPVKDNTLDVMGFNDLTTDPSSTITQLESTNTTFNDRKLIGVLQSDDLFSSRAILFVTVSCFLAVLGLCCVVTTLYLCEVYQKAISRSPAAWDMFLKMEKKAFIQHPAPNMLHDKLEGGDKAEVASPSLRKLLETPPHPLPSFAIHYSEKTKSNDDNDTTDFVEDYDLKFSDTESAASSLYSTPLAAPIELPTVDSTSSKEMLEVCTLTRPSWSVRATEAKHPTVVVDEQEIIPFPGGFRSGVDGQTRHTEQMQYRRFVGTDAVDVALAMQLRPGLGLDADSAWLVRFVMALFGWCAVLMSGTATNTVNRR